MLRLSTKVRYGLRAMIELARAYGKGPVMMSAIAKDQEISRKYLHALLTVLKKEGLVDAVRGAKGGFVLNRDPKNVAVSEICEALENNISIIDCVTDDTACSRINHCTTWGMWKRLNDVIYKVLSETTLQELVTQSEGDPDSKLGCELMINSKNKSGRKLDAENSQ